MVETKDDKKEIVDPNDPTAAMRVMKGGNKVEGSDYQNGGSRHRRPRKSKSGKTLRRKKMTMKQRQQQQKQQRQQQQKRQQKRRR